MIFTTKGIVFHRFKYSDNKTIVRIYTKEFGMQSYMFFGASSKKSKQILSLLQPLFILDMQVYHNEKRDIQKVKEISNNFPFKTISFNIFKNTISQFTAEFLMTILNDDDVNKDLFIFLEEAIKMFDNKEDDFFNFHILLLFKLTNLMGIEPQNNFSEEKKVFDLQAGKFIIGRPNHKNFANQKISYLIHKLFNVELSKTSNFKISNSDRRKLLDTIINFYLIHLGKPKNLKTLKILKEIF